MSIPHNAAQAMRDYQNNLQVPSGFQREKIKLAGGHSRITNA